ncbi:uncharacterized protein LOC109716101 [Ananas comosus]|uniref:Uncharacterized protein LOC109716101 n=1 Tax=Ananas comosus TaxID=4615 RepID=A0A6P5FV89_ANACO|nr:uncharacterized protein LOC109716101 [Ananas comosus]
MDSTVAKRTWHMVRAVYYMLRKGINKRKIMMDLQLLLHRGKIAGKSLRHLMSFHHHHHHHHHPAAASAAFSCLYVDPKASFHAPRDVEFSCSNTPASYPRFYVGKQKHKHPRHDHAAAEIAKVFEILNAEDAGECVSAAATPSPSPFVRQLRITDSPFPLREEEGEVDGAVDRDAEEFIKRFYEQLRLQPRSVGSTPECSRFGRRRTLVGRN